MLLEVLALPGLEVEPCVGEGAHVWEESFNERMKLVLGEAEGGGVHHGALEGDLPRLESY